MDPEQTAVHQAVPPLGQPGAVPPSGGVPPVGPGAAWGGTPGRKGKRGKQISLGIASIVAAAALVVGGSAGFVIGHSSSPTPTMGRMGGYGPMGGTPPDMGQLGTDSAQGQTQSS